MIRKWKIRSSLGRSYWVFESSKAVQIPDMILGRIDAPTPTFRLPIATPITALNHEPTITFILPIATSITALNHEPTITFTCTSN